VPAITTNDLKNGITLELDNGLFQVVEFQHVKPGKGGAFVRTKLRNVKNGNVFDRTFNAGVRVEQARLGVGRNVAGWHVGNVRLPGVEQADLLGIVVETSRPEAGPHEFRHQGQADVANADDHELPGAQQ